jgi:arylsulfatase A-like enzyme
MFEESMQMPLVARYPGDIPAGSVNEDIILNIDFAPTLLDFAGASPPDSVQGRSMRSNLQGETPDDWRTAMYYRYWMHGNGASRPAHYGIRTEEYKLIFYYGLPLDATGTSDTPTHPGWELYDLKRDPQEMDNVYEDPKYAEVIADLKAQLLALKEDLGDTDEQYPELVALREKFW